MAFSCRKAVSTGILTHFPDERPEGFKAPAWCAAAAIPLVPRPSCKCSTAAIRTCGDRRKTGTTAATKPVRHPPHDNR